MVPEGEERSGKFEDLFEDLDKFFAQGNPGPGRRGSGASGANEEEPAEDLLPPGWEPDIEGLDLGSDQGADARPPPEDGAPAGVGDDEAEPPTGRRKVEPPGELGGEDWARLRDALRDEGKQVEGEELGEAVAFDADADREERQELSLEDLKKAPPEYRDLPRSDKEEGDEEPAEPFGEEGEAPTRSEAYEGPASEPPSSEEPYWDEPDMADVEAAADNLAASFGRSPGPGRVQEELLADMEEPEGPRTVRVGGAEPMTGPTWEEPTSHPLMADQAAPPEPARNLPAAVLAAVALISLAVAKAAFAVVAGGVVLLGQAELYATMQRKGHQPATALGLVIGAFTLAGAYLKGEQAMLFFVVLGLMLSFLWYMAAAPKAREGALAHMGSTLLGVLYVPFLAGFILVILAQSQSGRALMLAVLGLTFIYDIAAFLFGSFWGSRPLAPTISPKKSWEGLFGATVVIFALDIAILPSIDPLNLVKSVGLATIVAVFAPLGDLAESAIKRDLGVKDMGSILPGHGGVLDRIDSVLFVAPAAFYFLRLIF